MEAARGKANDSNNERIDYSFSVEDDRIAIGQRRRGSPIDKVVSELMIYVNAEWGRQLANSGIAGIYRSQGGGKVRMSTSPAPHQGLGVSQYAWISSPMRRYVDFINQRQLVALLRGEPPPYTRESESLQTSMRDFEIDVRGIRGFSAQQWNATGACAGYCRKTSMVMSGTGIERKSGEVRSVAAGCACLLVPRSAAGNKY